MTKVRYRRTGGGEPMFEEQLKIEGTSFELSRLVSADAVGRFAGQLTGEQQSRLANAVDKVDGELNLAPDHGGTVLEIIDTGPAYATVPFETALPQPWAELRDVLRGLVEALKAQPVAALVASLGERGDEVTLAVVGSDPLVVSFDGASVRASLFEADGSLVRVATVPLPEQAPGRQQLAPGWRLAVPLGPDLTVSPQQKLQLTVDLEVDKEPGQIFVG